MRICSRYNSPVILNPSKHADKFQVCYQQMQSIISKLHAALYQYSQSEKIQSRTDLFDKILLGFLQENSSLDFQRPKGVLNFKSQSTESQVRDSYDYQKGAIENKPFFYTMVILNNDLFVLSNYHLWRV